MNNISILLAFSAGLLSFLSPCVLPLIPAYISYLTGSSVEELKHEKPNILTLYRSLGFILGFSIIFILMGLSITSISKILISHKDLFRKIGAIIIILFGLHTIGLFKIKLLYREKRFLFSSKIKSSFGAIIMGMAFAAGWTPCIGPILSSILIYATSMDSIGKGTLLLVSYSAGLAVPFILTAMFIGVFTNEIRKYSKYLPIISIVSGVLIIVLGILIFTNRLAVLSQYTRFINF